MRNCSARGPVVENDDGEKYTQNCKKWYFYAFRSVAMTTCNLNVIVVLEFISRDLYLLFAILVSSKFQNSLFYQRMRPKSGLKCPRPLVMHLRFHLKKKIY